MAPQVFIIGATGYIGGDVLHAMTMAHPEWEITALARNPEQGSKVAAAYPRVRLVYGSLDDEELLERESQAAGIVGQFGPDQPKAAHAILRGLKARGTTTGQPGFLVHTSGTGVLVLEDVMAKTFGTTFREKIYDDLDGVQEITMGLPDALPHRVVDKIVLAAAAEHANSVKTAIVCPPTIYGIGRGPDKRRSHQLPELCRATLEKGYAFKVNEGKTYWGAVYIRNLSSLFVKLLEEAVAGGSTTEWAEKPAVWGPEGYFFCDSEEIVWGEVSQWIADEGFKQGLFPNNEVKSIPTEEAATASPWGEALWGANSRGHGRRAREALKWTPTGPSMKSEIGATLEFEAKQLGLKKGHAEVAAGSE